MTHYSRALINMEGIRGSIDFTQRSPFDPTWTNFQLGAADQDYESNLRFVSSVLQYNVRDLPPRLLADGMQSYCNTTGAVYNPTHVDLTKLPPPGEMFVTEVLVILEYVVICTVDQFNVNYRSKK